MRRALKIAAVILTLLFGLAIWRNFFFYPKVWRARITIDGCVCNDCAIYVHRSHLGGVLVRLGPRESALYSLAFPKPNLDVPNGSVWKCAEGAFSFGPGFAYHSLDSKCAAWGTDAAQKHLRMGFRLVEFTADDGKRVRAEW